MSCSDTFERPSANVTALPMSAALLFPPILPGLSPTTLTDFVPGSAQEWPQLQVVPSSQGCSLASLVTTEPLQARALIDTAPGLAVLGITKVTLHPGEVVCWGLFGTCGRFCMVLPPQAAPLTGRLHLALLRSEAEPRPRSPGLSRGPHVPRPPLS